MFKPVPKAAKAKLSSTKPAAHYSETEFREYMRAAPEPEFLQAVLDHIQWLERRLDAASRKEYPDTTGK